MKRFLLFATLALAFALPMAHASPAEAYTDNHAAFDSIAEANALAMPATGYPIDTMQIHARADSPLVFGMCSVTDSPAAGDLSPFVHRSLVACQDPSAPGVAHGNAWTRFEFDSGGRSS